MGKEEDLGLEGKKKQKRTVWDLLLDLVEKKKPRERGKLTDTV